MQCKPAAFLNNLQFICTSSTDIGRACMPGVIIGNCLMYSWKKNYWLCENVTNIGVALQNVIPALNQPNVNFNFNL